MSSRLASHTYTDRNIGSGTARDSHRLAASREQAVMQREDAEEQRVDHGGRRVERRRVRPGDAVRVAAERQRAHKQRAARPHK